MDSSSSFRFRDQGMEDSTEGSSDDSLESSNGDEESELGSMTGKGINRLCSELLELKRASDEDFHENVFSNYSAFVRIFEEVGGVENELMQLKQHVSTQRKLVKDLMDGIYLEVLSKDSIALIMEESVGAEQSAQSKLEAHTNAISETLDILLSELRVDEALATLEMEAEILQMIQLEEDSPPQVLISYNSAISEKKSRLADQFALLAEHPRVTAPEFQKALAGLCRLGDSHRATFLLLKFYRSRLANGLHNLQCSKPFSHGTYIRELAKFVFSVISQSAKSFVVLYGETSPYASELIQWAREETEVFVCCFDKYVKSISEINGGLSAAVEAVQFAISFCSLLETQRIVLRPCLINLIRPCMEEVLQIHIDHFKKVVGISAATDTWVLGRYLVSGILNRGSSPMVIGHQLEYCLLTNSGRKFVTLLQAILKDISPLVVLQMEGSVLKGLADLFLEYIEILERAIKSRTNAREKVCSRINFAETLSQKFSVLANLSTLVHFFSSTARSIFEGINYFNSEIITNHAMGSQQKELDNWIFLIQEASGRLRANFCQQFIYRVLSPESGPKLSPEAYVGGQDDSDTFQDLMPTAAFQVLFWELRKLEKLAKDDFVGVDSLVELLRELTETIFVFLSNNQEFWTLIEESSSVRRSHGFEQFVLDMQFLVEITRFGGYFSESIMDASLDLVSRMESAFLFAISDPSRDVPDCEWAINAATEAIHKLQEMEKTESPPTKEPTSILEEDHKHQHGYASDSLEEVARTSLEDDVEFDDGVVINVSEAAFNTEQGIQEVEVTPLEGPIGLLKDETGLDDGSARNSTDGSVESEEMRSADAEIDELQKIIKTDVMATISHVDIVKEISDENGGGAWFPHEGASSPYDDSIGSIDEQVANVVAKLVINKLEVDAGTESPSMEVTELVTEDLDKLQGHNERHVDKDEFVLEEDCDETQKGDVGNIVKNEAADRSYSSSAVGRWKQASD